MAKSNQERIEELNKAKNELTQLKEEKELQNQQKGQFEFMI